MMSKFSKCELCNSYYKTDIEVHMNSIYCKDNNIIENAKIEQHEKACEKLIPNDHKYKSIHELRYNKFYYSQTLTRVICSIPERLTNMEYTKIVKEVKLIKRNPKIDSRGFFSRIFCSEQHSNLGFSKSIQQINHSFSLKKGTIRGMHYQLTPHADTKLINIIHGHAV